MANTPSIFNDVIGPVMRGPSSSHCAAALRIGRLSRDLMAGRLRSVRVEFDPEGSLATTHKSQGSDMGLFGGLLGWEAHDERLPDAESHLATNGIQIEIVITPINATHPNTYRLILDDGDEVRTLTAISTGGGMIEVIRIDATEVSMVGDYFVTLIFSPSAEALRPYLEKLPDIEEFIWHDSQTPFFEIRSRIELPSELEQMAPDITIRRLAPVLPVLSSKEMQAPFLSCAEMMAWAGEQELPLWELAIAYESARGGIGRDEVLAKMRDIIRIMRTLHRHRAQRNKV